MAYTTDTLRLLAAVKDGDTPQLWSYENADSVSTIQNASYFADGQTKGLRVGDVIMVTDPDRTRQPELLMVNAKSGTQANSARAVAAMTAGAGLAGTGTVHRAWTRALGPGVIRTYLLLDITGLNCGGTAGDIIGTNGTGAAYLGQITTAINGLIYWGQMQCLETPAGGDTDIDLYSATEATGVEDTAISVLTETQLINAGAQTKGVTAALTAWPAANSYLYLVGQGTGNATYTAGQFLFTFDGTTLT
jgi:hypothetical protein